MENKNFIDITKSMLTSSTPNSPKIKELNYWIINSKKVKVDGKNIVLDCSVKEKEIAEWLKNTFGGEIFLCPRVNYPEGIQTPDYIWNKEKCDLKEIFGSGKQVIYHSIYKKDKQSNNFIFDISNSKLSIIDIKNQISNLCKRDDTIFLKKAIIKKDKYFIVLKIKRM